VFGQPLHEEGQEIVIADAIADIEGALHGIAPPKTEEVSKPVPDWSTLAIRSEGDSSSLLQNPALRSSRRPWFPNLSFLSVFR
jgi:hypothetical protein